jgi:hypothetical protein
MAKAKLAKAKLCGGASGACDLIPYPLLLKGEGGRLRCVVPRWALPLLQERDRG